MTDDMFKQPTQGGGRYLKLEQFHDQLVLFRPSGIAQVPAYKKPTELVDEVTAEWVAFGPKGEDVTIDAKFKGAGLVRAAKEALRDPEHPWVLGVLVKVATKETTEAFKIDYSPEAFAECREKWLRAGAPDPKPGHAWSLGEYSPEQATRAAEYISKKARVGDPFKAATTE